MITNITQFINETLLAEEYHSTGIDNLLSIIKTNTINLSGGLDGGADSLGKKFFFLSLSRTSSKLGYHQDHDNICRIVFNGSKLNNNFKSMPVDYWGDKGKTSDINRSRFEYEDRIVTDKPVINNISNYIIRIEILIDNDRSDNYIGEIQDLIELCETKNIPIFVYNTRKDLTLKRNNINDKIKEKSIDNKEEPYSFSDRYIDYNQIVALLIYDKKYFDNYDLLKTDCNEYATKHKLPDIDPYKVNDYISSLKYGGRDYMDGLSAMLHNYFKSGKGGDFRNHVELLTKEIRKWKVNNVRELVAIKVDGIKPKGEKIDYRNKFGIYENRLSTASDYNKEEWELLDNSMILEDVVRIYFNTTSYGGYLRAEDMDVFFDLRMAKKTLGDFLNYLLNKYTLDKVKELIHRSGYDNYYKKYNFKLDAITNPKVNEQLNIADKFSANGGNKVVDKNGNPKVLYHGTNANFKKFKKTDTVANGRKYGEGFYFTDNIAQAEVWGKNIKKAIVSIINPLNDSPRNSYAIEHGIELPGFGSKPEIFHNYDAIKQSDIDKWIKENSYDGIIIENGYHGYEVIAFDESQIKIVNRINKELDLSDVPKEVHIIKTEIGFYWLVDNTTDEWIDGDRRLYVIKNMAKRWNLKITGDIKYQ